MYGGKRKAAKANINETIKRLKNTHGVSYFGIKDLNGIKRELNRYNSKFDTSGHAEFKALKNRVNKKFRETELKRNREAGPTMISIKQKLYLQFMSLKPDDIRQLFINNNNNTFEILIQNLSDKDGRNVPHENDLKTFLNYIRALSKNYVSNVSGETPIANYIKNHLINIIIITQLSIIQFRINSNVQALNVHDFFRNHRFDPPVISNLVHENSANRDLSDLYNSPEPVFSLENMINAAIIFKESSGIIKNVRNHYQAKNNIFYLDSLIKSLDKMYNYYYHNYIFYSKLVLRSLTLFNNNLNTIIVDYFSTLNIANPIDAQIIIYFIQKIVNCNFFIRNNIPDTRIYGTPNNVFHDTFIPKIVTLFKKLFHHKKNELIESFVENMAIVKREYLAFGNQHQIGYRYPTANIIVNVHGNILQVQGQAAQLPFNNADITTRNHDPGMIGLSGRSIRSVLINAFTNSVYDVNNLNKSYEKYNELLNNVYLLPEEEGATRSGFGNFGRALKMGLQTGIRRIKGSKLEYNSLNINDVKNNENNNFTNTLRNKKLTLNLINMNLQQSKNYLPTKQLPNNYITTNNGQIKNIYNFVHPIKTNVNQYYERRNRNKARNSQKIYAISQAESKYNKMKNKAKEEITQIKNTSENNALVTKIKTLVGNPNVANMEAKLTAYKQSLNAVKNINHDYLETLLEKLKTVKNAKNNYLSKIPVNAQPQAKELITTYKTKLVESIRPLLGNLAKVSINFKAANERYNINFNDLVQRSKTLGTLNGVTKNIKQIKELNKFSTKLKNNMNQAKRNTKQIKLNRLSEILEEIRTKYDTIIQSKNSYPDNRLKEKNTYIQSTPTTQTRQEQTNSIRISVDLTHTVQQIEVQLRLARSTREIAEITSYLERVKKQLNGVIKKINIPILPDELRAKSAYFNIHYMREPGNGRDRITFLQAYHLYVEQIEELYNIMYNIYVQIDGTQDITVGSFNLIKTCYKIIKHNIDRIQKDIFDKV